MGKTHGPSIFVFGHFGAGNFGDELMLEGFCRTMFEINPKFNLRVSSKKHLLSNFVASKVTPIPYSLTQFILAVFQSQALAIVGGTQFHDCGFGQVRIKHAIAQIKIACLVSFAWVLQKRIVLVGVGIGPFRSRVWKRCFGQLCRMFDAISVRDSESYETVCKMINQQFVCLADDLAITAIHARSNEMRAQNKHSVARLGISLAASFGYTDSGQENEERISNNLFLALQRVLREDANRTVIFFVLTESGSEAVITLTERLHRKLKAEFANRVKTLKMGSGLESTLEAMSECDWFLGMKFHGVVTAMELGCRVAAISYHPKIQRFMNSHGANHRVLTLLDAADELNVVNLLTELVAERSSSRIQVPWSDKVQKEFLLSQLWGQPLGSSSQIK
ncbi:polysaccharide pyruvyl transferase family protein [Neorhodopirellula pilleata]|uniref:Colanic acid biosynthesis protein n=1 Tax=Neorhodopirellula pilleata TaxID=2714738 RepID=A0A5C5ZQE7_9BACT|nr:polysaccharide pyruvyl transferase family protein [Neorhodopirellula pilleata]TWT89278.1 colanic acid biosynthesis protein [Neorhodopirellula pilleata]